MTRRSFGPDSPARPVRRLDDPDDDFEDDDFDEDEDDEEDDEGEDGQPWGDEDEGGPEWQATVGLSALDGLTQDQEPPKLAATSD